MESEKKMECEIFPDEECHITIETNDTQIPSAIYCLACQTGKQRRQQAEGTLIESTLEEGPDIEIKIEADTKEALEQIREL